MNTDNQIRSDLWHTMSMTELHAQHELLLSRMQQVTLLAGSMQTDSVRTIYLATQHALTDLAAIIDNKSSNPHSEGMHGKKHTIHS